MQDKLISATQLLERIQALPQDEQIKMLDTFNAMLAEFNENTKAFIDDVKRVKSEE
jgi:hypothetical protein